MHQQKKKEKSIFQSIFKAMLIVLIIELFLLVATLYFGNVGKQLNKNAVDILKKTGGKQTELSGNHYGRKSKSVVYIRHIE